MIRKDSPIIYICVALVGAILLTTSYHLSLQNKYKLCALIPALPVIGLSGLFFITLNKGNYKGYIFNHIRFLLITGSFYFLILFFLYFNNNLIVSLFFSFILWIILICINLFNY
tara:strand:+ start:20 stop:361 length:342 start_codon:yes stop_codon:yes gene_type:complete